MRLAVAVETAHFNHLDSNLGESAVRQDAPRTLIANVRMRLE